MMPKRTAKSCGSDAPGLASSLREEAQATVTTKPGHRGEREVSRKTIACGNAGCSGGPVVTTLVCLSRYTRGCGCIGARHSPRPLFQGEAKQFLQTSGASRREIAEACLKLASRHCERSEAIHLAAPKEEWIASSPRSSP